MTISDDLKAKILRYHHVEKWRVGTIAKQLHVHYSVIKRVLSECGIPKSQFIKKELLINPYLSLIMDTLKTYPNLTAARLYEMVKIRGYTGSAHHFRHLISLYRPRPCAEAYLRLRTLPGEQAQVDWGHFGHLQIGKAKRPLMAFVMVLSFSRKIFLHFYLNAQMSNFLQGHVAAFDAFFGVPKVLLYDNLKSAVLQRQGDAILFNPQLLEFASHYRFEPRPVAVARGNEKGRVERSIRYIRDNFFAARKFTDVNDLNIQATQWCDHESISRLCPEDKAHTVQETFLQEKEKLLQLPDNPYETHERVAVRIGKTPYARFDLNDYSIPHTTILKTVSVIASEHKISIVDGANTIAEHERCYDKEVQIENTAHIQALTEQKRKASKNRGQDRLIKSIPAARNFLIKAAERGYSMGAITSHLLYLLDRYGIAELSIAMTTALEKNSPHSNSVRLTLEKNRHEKNLPPPIAITLPDDRRVREMAVKPHDLSDYDALESNEDTQPENILEKQGKNDDTK